MTKLYRAILIDPKRQTVDVVVTKGTHEDTCGWVGAGSLDNFRIANHPKSFDYGWVDDTGLSRGQPVYAFKFDVGGDPIAGACLLIGANKETGATTDAAIPLDFVREHIVWLGLIIPEVFWEETARFDEAGGTPPLDHGDQATSAR
jgi:hypothetical protein